MPAKLAEDDCVQVAREPVGVVLEQSNIQADDANVSTWLCAGPCKAHGGALRAPAPAAAHADGIAPRTAEA